MLLHPLYMLFALGTCYLAISIPTSALEVGTPLPKDRDVFFRHYAYTWSEYLHLRPNGTYRHITRHHLFVEEDDHGTWTENPTGDVLLKSDLHYRRIVSGDLIVSVWHRERAQSLPDLKKKILHFLKSHRRATFSMAEVQRIRESPLRGSPNVRSSDINVIGNPINRADLEGLLTAIDEFMTSDTKNVFVLKPLVYRSAVIFVDNDRVSLSKQVIDQELALPPHPAYTPDKHGYHEIDSSRFAEESKETQEFIFFPEMNKLLKKHRDDD